MVILKWLCYIVWMILFRCAILNIGPVVLPARLLQPGASDISGVFSPIETWRAWPDGLAEKSAFFH